MDVTFAELAVLGRVIDYEQCRQEACFTVEADMFCSTVARGLFIAVMALFDAGEPVEPASIANRAQEGLMVGADDPLGSKIWATMLDAQGVVEGPENLDYYIGLLHAAQRRRALAGYVAELSNDRLPEEEIAAKLEAMQQTMVYEDRRVRPVSLADLAVPHFSALEAASEEEHAPVLTTGVRPLDNRIGGFAAGDFIVVGGRPGMGKSMFGQQCLRQASDRGRYALLFSREMPKQDIFRREIARRENVSLMAMRSAKMTAEEWEAVARATGALSEERLLLVDDTTPDIGGIVNVARKTHLHQPLGLVVVDYLQLVRGVRAKGDSREQEVSTVSRGLKQLAMDLECPVLALSQLSRRVDERPEKRPVLADLRESGSLEQDADAVLFLFRQHFYDRSADPEDGEIIVAKFRHGGVGHTKARAVLHRGVWE